MSNQVRTGRRAADKGEMEAMLIQFLNSCRTGNSEPQAEVDVDKVDTSETIAAPTTNPNLTMDRWEVQIEGTREFPYSLMVEILVAPLEKLSLQPNDEKEIDRILERNWPSVCRNNLEKGMEITWESLGKNFGWNIFQEAEIEMENSERITVIITTD